MLFYGDRRPFARGRSAYLHENPDGRSQSAKVWVRLAHASLPAPVLMEIDTGAAWTILPSELSEHLGLFEVPGEVVTMRWGSQELSGSLVRERFTLPADEGRSLEVEATIMVSREWRGPCLLGFSGFLERLRIGLDPGTNSFYFDEVSST